MKLRIPMLLLIVSIPVAPSCDKESSTNEPASESGPSADEVARQMFAEYEDAFVALAERAASLASETAEPLIPWHDLAGQVSEEHRRTLFGDLVDDERVIQAKAVINRSELDFRLVYMRSLNLRGRTTANIVFSIDGEAATARFANSEDLDSGETTPTVSFTLERPLEGGSSIEIMLMLARE